jgi:hypothetical protein
VTVLSVLRHRLASDNLAELVFLLRLYRSVAAQERRNASPSALTQYLGVVSELEETRPVALTHTVWSPFRIGHYLPSFGCRSFASANLSGRLLAG